MSGTSISDGESSRFALGLLGLSNSSLSVQARRQSKVNRIINDFSNLTPMSIYSIRHLRHIFKLKKSTILKVCIHNYRYLGATEK